MPFSLPVSKIARILGCESAAAAQGLPEELKPFRSSGEQRLLDNWLTIQGINLVRHAKSLRPFAKDEFGPSAGFRVGT